jgi:hypothetical protein
LPQYNNCCTVHLLLSISIYVFHLFTAQSVPRQVQSPVVYLMDIITMWMIYIVIFFSARLRYVLHASHNLVPSHNTSVDNTTLYLYTKIIYFVRATCFDLIRSSSGTPRRQIQE